MINEQCFPMQIVTDVINTDTINIILFPLRYRVKVLRAIRWKNILS